MKVNLIAFMKTESNLRRAEKAGNLEIQWKQSFDTKKLQQIELLNLMDKWPANN